MKYYVRVLNEHELGYRRGIPGGAGRFVLISKNAIGESFFPPLSRVVLNDSLFLRFLLPNGEVTVAKLVYHNDKFILSEGSRDEYRLYLNGELEYKEFKPGGLLVLRRLPGIELADYELVYLEEGEREDIRNEICKGSHNFVGESQLLENLFEGIERDEIEITIDEDVQSEILEEREEVEEGEEEVPTRLSRDANFRTHVLFFYNNQCAITGETFLLSYKGLNNLEAAHIKSHQSRGPDKVSNGMPLERNLHWAYDKGLFTIESNKVKVHPKVLDTNNYLTEFNEKELILPADVRAHPKVEYFEWHAENVYGLFTQFGEEDSGLSRYL